MVCKICGRTGFLTQKAEDRIRKYGEEAYERLKDKSCDELLEVRRETNLPWELLAAEKILIERGH